MALLEDSLIAHYKMNENTAGDNAELVTNGDFAAWTGDNPDGWTVVGESGADPEISEVGTGEGHGGVGTGMCNIYTSDGTSVYIEQNVTFVVGRKYSASINIDTIILLGCYFYVNDGVAWIENHITSTGTHRIVFTALGTAGKLQVVRDFGAVDVTFDDVSIKLCAIEDSSGNDHGGLAQQDSDAISVAGKINTALEFNGTTDYIEIPDHADFTPALTPFSISAWVNMDDATNFMVASKGILGDNDFEWRFITNGDDKLVLHFYDDTTNARIGRTYNTALTSYENSWINLVGTYDGGLTDASIKIYINGIRVDDINSGSASITSVRDLAHAIWIGRYSATYTNGTIDNVMFFSKELTPLEVQLLYNSGAGVETIPIGIHLSRTGQHFSSFPEN